MPTDRGRARGLAALTLATAVAAAAAGCVPNAGLPQSCHDSSVAFEATLVEERLEPGTFDACRGQEVSLVFAIERDGILHLHGYDNEVPAEEVRAGEPITFTFEAVRSGVFPIALHTSDGPAEVTVGTLIIHEP